MSITVSSTNRSSCLTLKLDNTPEKVNLIHSSFYICVEICSALSLFSWSPFIADSVGSRTV